MGDIILTTLGITWQIVPELYAFTNPGHLDLFTHHPNRNRLAELRKHYDIQGADSIWVITTQGSRTTASIDAVQRWLNCLPTNARPRLRIWQISGTKDLASEEECRRMQEAVHRVVLQAWEQYGPQRLVLSLAGGRKTMSSDMQQAASVFGTKALVHVVDNPKHSQAMQDLGPQDFTTALPQSLSDAVTPLVTGRFDPNPLVYAQPGQSEAIRAESFPLRCTDALTAESEMHLDEEPSLVRELERRSRQAEVLLCNYLESMRHDSGPSNFLAFRLLRPDTAAMLHQLRVGTNPELRDRERDWLQRLPKAELHCHLGGIANARELIEIAAANREEIALHASQLKPWLEQWRRRLEKDGVEGVAESLDMRALRTAVTGVPEPLSLAAFILLFADAPEELDKLVFGPCRKESRYVGQGFDSYEARGDLQGSGLLQNESSLRAACRSLVRKAEANNVRYLELRCSPANYTRGGLRPDQVVRFIQEELAAAQQCRFSLLFIASRHGSLERVNEHVHLAEATLTTAPSAQVPLCGFDLAGGEQARSPEEMRQALMPMLRECLHMTIHAGEIEDVESIWGAVYHLSAERIGHGLTLGKKPALLDKFRDRDIAIEMCPSSNMQIVGFYDAFLPSSHDLPVYPLKSYLDQGLRVTVNTDNPGISRTDMTNELHRAARMTPGGLSLWEICALVRNGFRAAFARQDLRHRLLRHAEEEVITGLKQANLISGA